MFSTLFPKSLWLILCYFLLLYPIFFSFPPVCPFLTLSPIPYLWILTLFCTHTFQSSVPHPTAPFLLFPVSGSSKCNFEPHCIHHFFLSQKFSRILLESTPFLLFRHKEKRPTLFWCRLLAPNLVFLLSVVTADGDDSQYIILFYAFLPPLSPFQAVQWIVPLQRESLSKERPGMRVYLIIYIWDDKPMMESKCLPKRYSHK